MITFTNTTNVTQNETHHKVFGTINLSRALSWERVINESYCEGRDLDVTKIQSTIALIVVPQAPQIDTTLLRCQRDRLIASCGSNIPKTSEVLIAHLKNQPISKFLTGVIAQKKSITGTYFLRICLMNMLSVEQIKRPTEYDADLAEIHIEHILTKDKLLENLCISMLRYSTVEPSMFSTAAPGSIRILKLNASVASRFAAKANQNIHLNFYINANNEGKKMSQANQIKSISNKKDFFFRLVFSPKQRITVINRDGKRFAVNLKTGLASCPIDTRNIVTMQIVNSNITFLKNGAIVDTSTVISELIKGTATTGNEFKYANVGSIIWTGRIMLIPNASATKEAIKTVSFKQILELSDTKASMIQQALTKKTNLSDKGLDTSKIDAKIANMQNYQELVPLEVVHTILNS